jgi:hypothetical protein
MNMRFLFLLFTLTCSFDILSAQTKVRIRVLDENDQPLKFVRLTLSGNSLPIETQSNGEYTLEFPPGKAEIVFYPPAGYERISPPNGTVLLPEDKSRTIDIWLARKGNDNRELESFSRVLSKKEEEKARLKIENENLKAQLDQLAADRQNTRAMRDSIESIVQKNSSLTSDLAREISALKAALGLKREMYFKNMAAELNVYSDRLKDLRDALPRVRDAFIDQKSMNRLDKTIAAYNTARDSLLQNHRGNAAIVRALWGTGAADALAKVYDKALLEVHQQTVLPLNTSLLDQFRAVRAEEIRPAKARKKAENAAKGALEKLNFNIPNLESDIRVVLAQLEAALHQNH